jgi:hypothetical protein
MIIFDSVTQIIIPGGRDQEWMLYRKQNVLAQPELVHPWQLLQLGVLTTNDYTKGIEGHGIGTILETDPSYSEAGTSSDNGSKGLFAHAIQVFTRYTETTSSLCRPTPDVQIGELIKKMEHNILRRDTDSTAAPAAPLPQETTALLSPPIEAHSYR